MQRKKHGKFSVGDRGTTTKGFSYTITEVVHATDIKIRFDPPTECTVKTSAHCLRSGVVGNPMEPTIAGIGCIGQGKYHSGSHKKLFEKWYSIFRRIYLEAYKPSNRSYHNATICDEWHNFQNFAEWMDAQGADPSWHLDKDLLVKGNTVYSPSTCIFLPAEINMFFTKRKMLRGPNPIGVSMCKKSCKYYCQWTKGGVAQYVGSYATLEAAFEAYKKVKEAYAKELAAKWQSQIDLRAYEALMNYTVEITD